MATLDRITQQPDMMGGKAGTRKENRPKRRRKVNLLLTGVSL